MVARCFRWTTVLLICNVIYLSAVAQNYVPGKLIVQFKSSFHFSQDKMLRNNTFGDLILDSLATRYKLSKISQHKSVDLDFSNFKNPPDFSRMYILQFDSAINIDEVISDYLLSGKFEYAEPDYIGGIGGNKFYGQPDDQYYYLQWGLNNNGTFPKGTVKINADINMPEAWDLHKGDSNMTIAVLDGGMRMEHPELAGRYWFNINEIPNNGLDDEGNNYVDDINGWNFADDNSDLSDGFGHGTNVAGIIGATGNNAIGYAGVNWNSKLMICKILDNTNSGLYTWWTDAIYYAVHHEAKVINMSVGGSSYSTAMKNAVDFAFDNNVVVIACMMNYDNNTTYYPAGYSTTIAVGATNPDDTRSSPFFWNTTSGSNYGPHINVVAPGNYIYGLDNASNTNYTTYWGGTSQAAPLVAGVTSLLLAQKSTLTPDDIRTLLQSTAVDQVGNPSEDIAGFDEYYGYGRIDAFEALKKNANTATDGVELFENDMKLAYHGAGVFSILMEKNSTVSSKNINYVVVNVLGQIVDSGMSLRNKKWAIQNKNLQDGIYLMKINIGSSMLYKKFWMGRKY